MRRSGSTGGEPDADRYRPAGGSAYWRTGGDRHGAQLDGARILDPLIELYRPVPPLAYLPLMVIWFGIGETSKILLIYRRFSRR